MTSNYKKIGDYIRLVDVRNKDLTVETLLGLSITKEFIPSVANTVGTNMANYKIIKKGQFACSLMQVRRDKRIPVALQSDFDEAIISQAYPVFEVVDSESLDPEYLMMWMSRSEFDRHACFLAVGGVRGSLEWDDFCDMELPVPSIEKQREIVREYNVVNYRIALNEQLTQKLEDTAQAIYKQWFVDFEFPISKEYAESIGKPELEGKPYKSSGGEMNYSAVLDKNIPSRWRTVALSDVGDVVTGKTPSSAVDGSFGGVLPFITPTDYKNYTKCAIGSIRALSEIGKKSLKNKILPPKSLLVTCIGSDMGKVVINVDPCITNQQINALVPYLQHSEFLYYLFDDMYEHLRNIAIGSSTMPMLNKTEFEMIEILYPSVEVLDLFESKMSAFTSKIKLNKQQIDLLYNFKTLLLQKITGE